MDDPKGLPPRIPSHPTSQPSLAQKQQPVSSVHTKATQDLLEQSSSTTLVTGSLCDLPDVSRLSLSTPATVFRKQGKSVREQMDALSGLEGKWTEVSCRDTSSEKFVSLVLDDESAVTHQLGTFSKHNLICSLTIQTFLTLLYAHEVKRHGIPGLLV